MYLSGKGASSGDKKLSAAKATLNPNASEFVPFALRSPTTSISSSEASSKYATIAASAPGKGVLDRSESSVSNNSDDEAQQYWRLQLPDDITPDFKVMGIDDTQGINSLSFSSLSLTDIDEGSRYSPSTGSGFMLKEQQVFSPRPANGNSFAEKLRYPLSSYGEYPSPTGFHPSLAKPWDQQIVGNDQLVAREGLDSGNPRQAFLGDLSNEQLLVDNAHVNPLEFLASQFPGFAAESLAEVYFANGGDLNLTIEMLTQLELQVDGGLNQNSKALSSPNLSAMDFPALSVRWSK
ncbi:UNVERIFIED_CONTAM: Polyadenylate-binding protein-interacting protein 7 [Sesamum radiatum]|uniref:Polyadenylate-binding protein-interacting protein 7 n=1 Tax=Sesamum radiatum TaxID=300843 RepID=A0AAW2JR89_SESRA